MNIETIFENIGFDNQKTKVYMAILSLGSTGVSEISKKTKLARTTVYKILPELVADGLAEEAGGKVKKYRALHPSNLVDLLRRKTVLAESAIPELLGIFSSSHIKPKMRFYEGEAGKKRVFEDILKFKNEIVYTFSSLEEIVDLFGKTYVRHYMEKRVKNGIWRYDLRIPLEDKDEKEWEFYGSDIELMRKIRFLPKEINCNMLIQIYADRVSVMAIKENYAFIVESTELANFLRQIFLYIWETSKSQG